MVRVFLRYTVSLCTIAGSFVASAQSGNTNYLETFNTYQIGSGNSAGTAFIEKATNSIIVDSPQGNLTGTLDECFFVHKPVSGDLEFVVRLDGFLSTGVPSKAGIMIRSSLESDSAQVSIVMDTSEGIIVLFRPESGAPATRVAQVPGFAGATHLAIIRKGDLFSVYYATESASLNWLPAGAPIHASLPTQLQAGLCVASNSGKSTVAEFSELTIRDSGIRDARFVGQYMRNYLSTGEDKGGTLVFENSGTLPWVAEEGFRLSWAGSQVNPWGIDHLPLEPGTIVQAGESYEFALDLIAPWTPGTYGFQWQMVQEGAGAFGEKSPLKEIEVTGVAAALSSPSTDPYAAFQADSFTETNGLVIFEAEAYKSRSVGSAGEKWINHGDPGASGYSLKASPNRNVDTGLNTTGARVDYYFHIRSPGEYYLYVRGQAQDGRNLNDTIHAAVNGVVLTNQSGKGFGKFGRLFGWKQQANQPLVKVKASINKVGVHKLSIWSREDGVIIDRIALGKDGNLSASYLDSRNNSPRNAAGNGDPTSPQTSAPVAANPISDSSGNAFAEKNGLVIFEAEKYIGKVPGSRGERWDNHGKFGASGYTLKASPNRNVDTGLETTGGQVYYYFNIKTPGDYYLYVRGADMDGNTANDSIHVAINNQVLTNDSGYGLGGFVKSLGWRQKAGAPLRKVKLNLGSGTHKLSIWSREDGVIIDRIALSNNGSLTGAYLNSRGNSQVVSADYGNASSGDGSGSGGGSTSGGGGSSTTNNPPVVANAIPDQTIGTNQFWSYTIPASTFRASDSASLSLTASGLPLWLPFNGSLLRGTSPWAAAEYTVTIRASDGSNQVSDSFKLTVQPASQSPFSGRGITVADTTWSMIHLTWHNPWGDRKPLLLQRRQDTNFTNPNLNGLQSYENFIWLGHGSPVTRYKDLFNWQQAGKRFYYRITAVLNYSDVINKGAQPVFGKWKTTSARLDNLPSNWKTYNVTWGAYGADKTGRSNSWHGIVAAVEAAKAAGGGRVLLPAGVYNAWPTDSAVRWDGRYLSANPGAGVIGSMINGQTSNIVIEGEVDANGKPRTRLNLRMWHNRSGKDFLVRLNRKGGNPANDADIAGIRRYGFWKVGENRVPVENVQLRNIHVDMTAVPVQTGKDWQSLNGKRYQWDPSHKLVYGFNSARNILVENVVAENIRGEICYWGGFGCEKYKLSHVSLSKSNSSILSMSADAEFEHVYMADAANALVESVPHSVSHNLALGQPLISRFGKGLRYFQDTIIRNVRGRVLDQSAQGVMRHLPGPKNFAGIHVMNQKGTYFSLTDTLIEEFNTAGFAPWHENHNGFVTGLTLKNPARSSVRMIDFRPSPKFQYKLDGGMENMWLTDIWLDLNRDINDAGALLYTASGLSSMNDTIIDGLHVVGNGHSVNRVWKDIYGSSTGRNNFVLSNWSHENLISPGTRMMVDMGGDGKRISPKFGPAFDFFVMRVSVTDTNPNFRLEWPEIEIDNHSNTTTYSIRPTNLASLRVGQEYVIRTRRSGETVRLSRGAWNTFNQNYSVTGNQRIRCKVVLSSGVKKLAFVRYD